MSARDRESVCVCALKERKRERTKERERERSNEKERGRKREKEYLHVILFSPLWTLVSFVYVTVSHGKPTTAYVIYFKL